LGSELEITILGEKKRCVAVPESPWDGENARLKGVNRDGSWSDTSGKD